MGLATQYDGSGDLKVFCFHPNHPLICFLCSFFPSSLFTFITCNMEPTVSQSDEIDLETKKRIFVVECYWYCHRSCTEVRRRFRAAFGRNVIEPGNFAIQRLVSKFSGHGTIANLRKGNSGRPRSATSPEEVSRVEQFFEDNPTSSTRRASAELDISRSSIQRIIKKEFKLYPYKIQVFQMLSA